MVDFEALESIDELLFEFGKVILPLYHIEPINEAEQKELFLKGEIKNPNFKYKNIEYDSDELRKNVESIEIPDSPFSEMYRKKQKSLLLEDKIVVNRGDEDIVRSATVKMHGLPSQETIIYADEILRTLPRKEAPKIVPSDVIKESLETALLENGLDGWSVEYSDKKLTTVIASKKKITICKHREFAEMDSERLKVHEVGVHTIRAANGYMQPLKIFATGFPGYLSTEEGLTTYFEEITGNSSDEILRDYASRVIAVDSVLNGLNFINTFERLKEYGYSDDKAWDLSLRAYRGGGYIKDHIYLEGYSKVKEFAANNGDFRTLYVGKVGIEDISLMKSLLTEGIIEDAKHLPYFLKNKTQ